MSENSVTQYGEIARALREIAGRIDGLMTLAAPCDYVCLSILPNTRYPQAECVATVDALATALLGGPGKEAPGGSGWHHAARGDIGPVEVSIHTAVTGPAPDEVTAELIRLRAEVEHLRKQFDEDDVEPDAARLHRGQQMAPGAHKPPRPASTPPKPPTSGGKKGLIAAMLTPDAEVAS